MSRYFDETATLADADDEVFFALMCRLSPDRRRIIDTLLRRVAVVEDAEGETAALSLIENIASILVERRTTH
ncbi:MAG: hypothetical protein Q8L23_14030 [Caulobacter sp.]|nr:hypothetical protein [Caulobacter sp.]